MACGIHGIQLFAGILLLCFVKKGWSAAGVDVAIELEPVYTRRFQKEGESLIIGTKATASFEEVFPEISDALNTDILCSDLEKSIEYNKDFRTKLQYSESDNNYDVLTSDIKKDAVFDEFFYITSFQVFECRPDAHLYSERVSNSNKFYKVRNNLVGKPTEGHEIRELKHYDGVEIATFDCGDSMMCLSIKEIKCFRYQGQQAIFFKCREWKQTHIYKIYIPGYDGDLYTHHTDAQIDTSKWKSNIISEKGSIIRIGSTVKKGDRRKFICSPPSNQLVPFQSKVHQLIDGTNDLYAELAKDAFHESFTILAKCVRACESEGNSNHKIYQVYEIIMSEIPIKEIKYSEYSIQNLYALISQDDNIKRISYHNMEYYDAITREPVTFEVELVKRPDMLCHPSYFVTENRKVHDTLYKLTEGLIFSIWISSEGFDLTIGSDAKTIGFENTIPKFKCIESDLFSKYKTDIKVRLNDNGQYYTQINDDKTIIPVYTSKQAWECVQRGNSNFKIVRVANRFRLHTPIHEILTYDGVEVMVIPTEHGTYVDILEIKYLYEDEPVKISASFEFDTEEEIYTSYSMSNNYYAIKNKEIIPAPTHEVPLEREHFLEDFWDKNEHYHLQFPLNSSAKSIMNLVEFAGDNEKEPLLFLCSKITDTSTYDVFMRIQSVKGNTRGAMAPLTNYFEPIIEGKEVFLCESCEELLDARKDLTGQERNKEEVKTKVTVLRVSQMYRFKSEKFSDIALFKHTYLDKFMLKISPDNGKYELQLKSTRFFTFPYKNMYSSGAYTIFKLDNEDLPMKDRILVSGTMKSAEFQYKEENSRVLLPGDHTTPKYSDLFSKRWGSLSTLSVIPSSVDAKAYVSTLGIGSTHTDTISGETLICETGIPYSENERKFLTQAVYTNGQTGKNEYLNDKDFVNTMNLVWDCTDPKTQRKILRVMNRHILEMKDINRLKIGEIYYIDEIVITYSEQLQKFEIIEVKYLDSVTKKVVRFGGNVQLGKFHISSDPSLVLRPQQIVGEYFVVGTRYMLKRGEIFKTTTATYGIKDALEIGKYVDVFSTPQLKLQCIEGTGEDNIPDQLQSYLSKIKKIGLQKQKSGKSGQNKNSESNFLVPVEVKETDGLYDLSGRIFQICSPVESGDENKEEVDNRQGKSKRKGKEDKKPDTYYRIITSIQLKKPVDYIIYHYDGVTVFKNEQGQIGIRFVDYVVKRGSPQQNEPPFYPVKFDGLISFYEKSGDDFNYIMSASKFEFEPKRIILAGMKNGNGPTIEISSEYDNEHYHGHEELECEQIQNLPYVTSDSKFKTVFTLNEDRLPVNPTDTTDIIFHYRTQEMWQCRSKHDEMQPDTTITRVVNKLFSKHTNLRIYHAEGVRVGLLTITDTMKVIQVTQEKFYEKKGETLKYINYGGKVRLIMNPLIGFTRFFRNSAVFDVPRACETCDNMMLVEYPTLDSIRMYANGKYSDTSVELNNFLHPMINEGNILQTYLVNTFGRRMYQLGYPSTKKLENQHIFKCFQFMLNGGQLSHKIFPRVGQYIGVKLYILSEEEVGKHVEITKRNLYLCTNTRYDFFKMDFEYNIERKNTFAVRYYDTVHKIETVESKPGTNVKDLLRVSESIIIDIMGRNVYSYNQNLQYEVKAAPSNTMSKIKSTVGNLLGRGK